MRRDGSAGVGDEQTYHQRGKREILSHSSRLGLGYSQRNVTVATAVNTTGVLLLFNQAYCVTLEIFEEGEDIAIRTFK